MPVAFFFRKAVAGAGLALAVAACQSNSSSENQAATTAGTPLTAGTWRGVLSAQGQEIPFLFDVATDGGKPTVTLRNGEERLKLDEISSAGDSTTIRLGVFDAALVVHADGADKLRGTWVKYDGKEPYRVPFSAAKAATSTALFTGDTKPVETYGDMKKGATFRVEFKGDDGETYPAVGIITQDSVNTSQLTGTFLTSTGDYRYLAGNLVNKADGEHILLSTFDGSHGFLFDGKLAKPGNINNITGDFYAGKSGHETWTAVLDGNAKLPDANALAGMKPGQKKLDFKFPSVYEGGSISPTDPKYKGKVVVLQILGSWCPNCMDETNFLAPWYEKNKQRGVEIIGLGYERTSDQKLASQKLLKMKQRLNVGYDLAVAGVANKDSAANSLPQLAKVVAFPTTIFLDKKGEVRKIHTGFSGPGTGKYYQQETEEFEKTVASLLAE
ncbi:TlpA family protein disulfide reductase [Hymenobacter sp. BT186]|uniref:TlpA family protein disulfide reductase n=1 Tax=Hymenobacter telluris TaxID=2816474 RepID=A0A939EYV8_9BACT|nr:TlpA disulfide reductase family protein [Hymenobacter telluris]MBO0359988.1 TlpA family protein disulfide reductase [Hymenobacter telluris]MBW3376015.1 TlpA family protein disulfide reductase [Hymenobacter norwichensis]